MKYQGDESLGISTRHLSEWRKHQQKVDALVEEVGRQGNPRLAIDLDAEINALVGAVQFAWVASMLQALGEQWGHLPAVFLAVFLVDGDLVREGATVA
jgi:hypothetical protein